MSAEYDVARQQRLREHSRRLLPPTASRASCAASHRSSGCYRSILI